MPFLAALLIASAPNPVVDEADVLAIMDETSLASQLASVEASDHVQIVVATFERIPRGETAYSHSLRMSKIWEVGKNARNGGVVIAFYEIDREVHIQLTESVPHLTNGQVKRIIDEQMVPRFLVSDIPGGLRAGAAEVLATVRGQRIGAGATTRPTRGRGLDSADMAFGIVVVVIVLAVLVQMANGSTSFGPSGYRRRSAFNPFWGSTSRSSWSSGRSSWGGGRSSGGGGFRGRGAGGKW